MTPVDDASGEAADDAFKEPFKSATVTSKPQQHFQRIYTLSTHDKPSSQDVYLNETMFPADIIKEGTLMQVGTLQSSPLQQSQREVPIADPSGSGLFYVKFANPELLSRQPKLQVSVPQQIAAALHLSRGSSVLLSAMDELDCRATHVELVFRDQYLARADMWRLINSQLAGQCIYRGQSIEFIGTIKVMVKAIFIGGRKVNSALFHASTKPIFRSESARYILFIQMSKEMWDFDVEGTGEIMFDKVVNGFLPEIFKRWQQMQVRHLVSIVLFARMEYDGKQPLQSTEDFSGRSREDEIKDAGYKDYYRVVVSDMASIESPSILDRLKKEFLEFLRDTTTQKPVIGEYIPLGAGLSAASAALPDHIICGQPCVAARGNILEAINLASSQFSSDYIDRDLVATGVSIVIISPGTALFEVDYDLLVATTESLTENGVGIDLVCLSGMPLHSVPLFKYRPPSEQVHKKSSPDDFNADTTPTRSFSNTMSYGTPSISSSWSNPSPQHADSPDSRWNYGVPHWVDVSFWTTGGGETGKIQHVKAPTKKSKSSFDNPRHKPFTPRVRMYELQMMGVMENVIDDISIPMLPHPSQSAADSADKHVPQKSLRSTSLLRKDSWQGSLNSRDEGCGMQMSKISTSPLSVYEDLSHKHEASLRWMDEYDDVLFCHPTIAKSQLRKANKHSKHRKKSALSTNPSALRNANTAKDRSKGNASPLALASNQKRSASVISNRYKAFSKPILTSQKISFGPRGLRVGAPLIAAAIADTSPVSRNASEPQVARGWPSQLPNTSPDPSDTATTLEQVSPETATDTARGYAESSQEDSHSSNDSGREITRPIPIRQSTVVQNMKENREGRLREIGRPKTIDRVATLQDLRDQEGSELSDEIAKAFGPDLPTLSPCTSMAPWLTLLNPCNPSKKNMDSQIRLGRWHHIFPQPLKTSQIKWKSLCSPAALPLTTEDFPSADQIQDEYRERSYLVTLPEEMDITDGSRSLTNELLAFRLAHGFQIVIGDRLADAVADPSVKSLDVFNDRILAQSGSFIYLSRGSVVHLLTRVAPDRVEIRIYFRHTLSKVSRETDGNQIFYTPLIRSMLADQYENQAILIASQRGVFDWSIIDSFIVGHERLDAAQSVEKLRPGRARFVLIPVEVPATSHRRKRSNEDTEEEIRLEGIQRLTQIWQKSTYITPENRRFATPSLSKEDANPLEVKYYTKNPSAVVAEELENAVAGDANSTPIQLLPETDLCHRSNLDIKSLSNKIQSAKGVRLVDRRWHWKLHHRCFIGSELTTWLLENFRDVRDRQEAVDLGNVLMDDGLFKHVEKRHEFRDGHYFYQMGDDYRSPRSESKSLFGWTKASIPPTPVREAPPPEPTVNTRSRANSDIKTFSNNDTSKPLEKEQRPSVALSKSLIYNLDERHRRSYREELVKLHYDRLHNPENCYHIRLEWMNTTPKLIQDAVNNWARSVETHGLRLVEVPIGEASSITSMHPFRAPYLIKLVREPPVKQTLSHFNTDNSLPRIKPAEKNFYQKALLRRFNFVLDLEAASDFDAGVDVTYSWGKPDYRYSQYIHESGLVIAQITDEGHFLLLANRLFNNRNSIARAKMSDNQVDVNSNYNSIFYHSNPLRPSASITQPASPRPSPFSSPALPAALDVSDTSASKSRSPLSSRSRLQGVSSNLQGPLSSGTDVEKLTRGFRDFCHDPEALKIFYEEQVGTPSSLGLNKPGMSAKSTPKRGPDPALENNSIPDLTLPGNIIARGGLLDGGDSSKKRSEKPSAGSGSPKARAVNKSVAAGGRSPLIGIGR
ncbi:MAG: hypothetical protein Q9164_001560 [Protoblastenia rupestris]